MKGIKDIIIENKIPYNYIWVYLREDSNKELKKTPIGEVNNKSLEDIMNDNNEYIKNKKPKTSYINKKIHILTE